jgi:hypothetical protein
MLPTYSSPSYVAAAVSVVDDPSAVPDAYVASTLSALTVGIFEGAVVVFCVTVSPITCAGTSDGVAVRASTTITRVERLEHVGDAVHVGPLVGDADGAGRAAVGMVLYSK